MYLYWLSIFIVMRFIHELLARMIGATPSHVLTLKDRLIDWLWQTDRPLRGWATRRWRLGALSIIPFNKNSGLKFRKFHVPNGTVHSGCTAPTQAGYKRAVLGTTILSNKMERDISVRPTEITGPVKVDHLQSWSRTFRSDQIEMVRSIQLSIWCTSRNFRNFGLNGKRLTCLLFWTRSSVFWEIDMSFWVLAVVTLQIFKKKILGRSHYWYRLPMFSRTLEIFSRSKRRFFLLSRCYFLR